ncbi:hypothetical protein [Microbacterium candidum]|uniref:Peptidase C39-like domain-containing protein n=1 Tax=Microbacterium candidum TaxID=3041922 RepID=A0ABT7MVP2_9MICO|nr:hypothetical protein [Microbacterium sp. ASV49]MDL9978532.1 hypothetical protein [Microbacterium sp. ASV49]
MVTEDLGTEYHQQDTNYYCGAACAQMILQECGMGHIDQSSLYTDNHDHSTAEAGWYTAPDGLAWTLNHRQSGRYFVLDALATEDTTSRMIAWTIHHYRVAPAALVFGSAHWITIRGYQANGMPSSSMDVGYSLQGFFVNNPWPPVPSGAAEPPHSTGDGCGSGGTRGVADEYISYSTWQADYMTGASGGLWGGKYVAICDPEPPPDRNPERVERQLPKFDGRELLDSRAAVELSRRGFEEAGLYEEDAWRHALEGTEPGEPQLVQRLDRADQFYWIVPQMRNGRASAVLNVDARFGDFRQGRALPDSENTALLTLTREEVDERLHRKMHKLSKGRGGLTLRPGIACISRHWVWRPCAQSLSPYYPFKMVSYGDHRLYVRSDGRVFTALTPAGRGI